MKRTSEFWMRIAITAFVVCLIILVPAILLPFGLSLFLAVLLSPLARRIQRGVEEAGVKRFPFDLSIVLSFLVFILVLSGIIVYILVPFVKEFRQFLASVPDLMTSLQAVMPQLERAYYGGSFPPEIRKAAEYIVTQAGSYTLQLAQFSLSAIFSVAGTMVELIVVPFITFYMIKKGGAFRDAFISLFPARYSAHLTALFREMRFVLFAYIRGQLILSSLMALVVFVGMWALHIPYPLVMGLLSGVVEMVPVLGPVIGAIPPVLLALVQSSGLAVQVILFYIIVQQLDAHLVMPKVMGSVIRVHPVTIITGVLLGGHLYGVVGMMISVPVLAVLQVLFRHMWFYDTYKELYSGDGKP